MSLILTFQPGDRLLIGDQKFDVEIAGRCLRAKDGTVYDISSQSVSPVHGVLVQVADAELNTTFMLAVSAPRRIRIARIRREASL